MQLKRFTILALLVLACLLFTVRAQGTDTGEEEVPEPEPEPEPETPVYAPYIPPNFIFVSAAIRTPAHGLGKQSGLYQRVLTWAQGCIGTDVQLRMTSFNYARPYLTVDIITTLDLVAGCSPAALELALESYQEAKIVKVERSTPSQVQGACVVLAGGLWMPSCNSACASWECAYTAVKSDSSVITLSLALIVTIFGALIF